MEPAAGRTAHRPLWVQCDPLADKCAHQAESNLDTRFWATTSATSNLSSTVPGLLHHGIGLGSANPSRMSKTLLVLFLGSLSAWSQTPHYQLFVGGSGIFVHASGAEAAAVTGTSDAFLQQHNLNFNLYGWEVSAVENVKPWLGGEIEASGNYGTPQPNFLCSASSISNGLSCLTSNPLHPGAITKLHTFEFGPRFRFNTGGRVSLFVHALAGPGHISGSISRSAIFLPSDILLPQGFSKTSTALTVVAGGGIDLNVSPRFAIRVIQVDYVMTRFYSQRQDLGRASAGVIWSF